MTETSNRREQPQHIIDVPNSINMVSLLGPNDEHLSLIESGFDADDPAFGEWAKRMDAPRLLTRAQAARGVPAPTRKRSRARGKSAA